MMITNQPTDTDQTPQEIHQPGVSVEIDAFGEGIDIEAPCGAEDRKSSASENSDSVSSGHDTESPELLGKLPPEIAMLLVVAGVGGVLLPGPVGAPLLIAGGVALWPKTFSPIERWFSKRFPSVHREGVAQIKGFLADLEKRFPDGDSKS